jgi:hypothetical protein
VTLYLEKTYHFLMQLPVFINEICCNSHICILNLRSPAICCQAHFLTRTFKELLQLGSLFKIKTNNVPCASSSRWKFEMRICFGQKFYYARLLTKTEGLLIFYYHLSKCLSKCTLIKPPCGRSFPMQCLQDALLQIHVVYMRIALAYVSHLIF